MSERRIMKICIYCHREATDRHHIIPRSQSGSDNHINLANLCRTCHNQIHFGTNTRLKKLIKLRCYEQIRGNLSLAWKGKIRPAIINKLIAEGY
jgi:5-methylcytosine-specific restriction endonuclease McrA